MRRFVRYTSVLIGGILCALLAGEIFTRLLFSNATAYTQNDPANGLVRSVPYSQYKMTSSCFSNDMQINRYGFYGPDVEPEKPSGTRRIVFMGNSFVESNQLPLNQGFAGLVGKALSSERAPVQTASFGGAGNGTYLDLVYQDQYAKQLHPDVIVLLATEGNPPEDLPESAVPPRYDASGRVILALPPTAAHPLFSTVKNLSRQSALFVQLAGRIHLAKARSQGLFRLRSTGSASAEGSDPARAFISDRAWESEARLLAEAKRLMQEQGTVLVLMSWDSHDGSVSELGKGYAKIAASLDIPFLDLNAAVGSDDPERRAAMVWSCDAHWSAYGHTLVADAMTAYFRAHPEIWKTTP